MNFYMRHGFSITNNKKYEENTIEVLVHMEQELPATENKLRGYRNENI